MGRNSYVRGGGWFWVTTAQLSRLIHTSYSFIHTSFEYARSICSRVPCFFFFAKPRICSANKMECSLSSSLQWISLQILCSLCRVLRSHTSAQNGTPPPPQLMNLTTAPQNKNRETKTYYTIIANNEYFLCTVYFQKKICRNNFFFWHKMYFLFCIFK